MYVHYSNANALDNAHNEQKRIRTVPEQYQTSSKNHEKTKPNPKNKGKNRPHQ